MNLWEMSVCLRLYHTSALMSHTFWTNSTNFSRTHKPIKRIHTHKSSFSKLKWLISQYRCENMKASPQWAFISNGKHFRLQKQRLYTNHTLQTDSCVYVSSKFCVSKHSILMQAIIVSFTFYSIEYSSILRRNIWITITAHKQTHVRLGTCKHAINDLYDIIKPNERSN